MKAKANLGIIEGFFGRPWSWDERAAVLAILAPAGFRFYHYAPKADSHLRRNWAEPHSAPEAEQIARFAHMCADMGVVFGVGLSPYQVFNDFNPDVRAVFQARVRGLAGLCIRELGIFFDDMHADQPDLAARQIDIVAAAQDAAPDLKLTITPSYYSNDPVLDRVFGQRPPQYLAELGQGLDPGIGIYWTGEEVCSKEYRPGHLKTVAEILQRKPLLWDNYPVNDGPRMSKHLHLRAFTGRSSALIPHLAGHAINPASQALLSCIPALTLVEAMQAGDDYCYTAAWQRAADAVVGPDMAAQLLKDLLSFEDMGRDQLAPRLDALMARYAAISHPAAREVCAWLNGDYAITGEAVQTQ